MKNNFDAKIIILVVCLMIAFVPWSYLLIRNFIDMEDNDRHQSIQEEFNEPGSSSDDSTLADDISVISEPGTETGTEPIITEPSPEPSPEIINEEPIIPDHPEPVIININELYSGLSDALDEISIRFDCVAVSLTVYDGTGSVYYTYEFGYSDLSTGALVNADTKMRVASLSKLATVICAMTLADAGKLDLDEDISEYLKIDVINPGFPDTPITTRMLMQHTSSINDSPSFESSRFSGSSRSTFELLGMRDSYLNRKPGAGYTYSNFGYSVIAAVCEMISGKSFDTLAREILFEPLNIDAAFVPSRLRDTDNIAAIYNESRTLRRSVEVQLGVKESGILGHDHHFAQGNLTISTADYSKILAMLGAGGVFNGIQILSEQAVIEIHDTDVQGTGFKQGLGTRYSGISFLPESNGYWHTGSAYGIFAQYLYGVSPGHNSGVVVVTTGASINRTSNGMINVCNEMSKLALSILNFD